MVLQRAIAVCVGVMVIPVSLAAQQSASSEQKPGHVTSVTDRTYPQGNRTPWRLIETRTSSAGRELIVEKLQSLDPNNVGKLRTVEETTVEVIRGGTRTTETVGFFGIDGEGRRQLIETTESTQVIRPGGSETVRNTFAADLNGRLALTSRRIEEARSAPNLRESD